MHQAQQQPQYDEIQLGPADDYYDKLKPEIGGEQHPYAAVSSREKNKDSGDYLVSPRDRNRDSTDYLVLQ